MVLYRVSPKGYWTKVFLECDINSGEGCLTLPKKRISCSLSLWNVVPLEIRMCPAATCHSYSQFHLKTRCGNARTRHLSVENGWAIWVTHTRMIADAAFPHSFCRSDEIRGFFPQYLCTTWKKDNVPPLLFLINHFLPESLGNIFRVWFQGHRWKDNFPKRKSQLNERRPACIFEFVLAS